MSYQLSKEASSLEQLQVVSQQLLVTIGVVINSMLFG